MGKDTAAAQDEIISLFLAPMQRKIDRLKAENKRRDIEQAEYQAEKDGFNNQDARAQVEIFDDLGIFDEKELFCKNRINRVLKGQIKEFINPLKENNKNVSIELIICI